MEWPNLLVAYHPDCPHCKEMVQGFKDFAKLVKTKQVPINVQTINMSKSDGVDDLYEDLGITEFPTIRLYMDPKKKGDKNFVEFLDDPAIPFLMQFLHKLGIKNTELN